MIVLRGLWNLQKLARPPKISTGFIVNSKQPSPNQDSQDSVALPSQTPGASPSSAGNPPPASSDTASPANDNRFLLVTGSLFFAIMAGQYVWKTMDKPDPLIWNDGPASMAFKLNVNTATWAEWAQLEDIGPELAMQIVADRDENGEFRSIDDVSRVAGIGASTLDGIRPLLTMGKRPVKTLRPDGHSIEPAENQ